MTAILVDTSVIIDVLRGSGPAMTVLATRRRDAPLRSSEVVRAEVLAGMRADEEERTRRLLDAFAWYPVDEGVAEEAGRLGRRWLPSHSAIDTADLLIAATAITRDLELLTANVRHFPMFAELVAPY